MSMRTALSDILARMSAIDPAALPDAPEVEACPVCNGLGVVNYSGNPGDAHFGKLYPCPANCEAVLQTRRAVSERVMHQSAWNTGYDNMTFDSFLDAAKAHGANGMAGKRGAYAAALVFASSAGQAFTLDEAARRVWNTPWPNKDANVSRPSNCLVLTGDVGTGKTGLAVAATNALREQSQSVIFMRVQRLIADIQETYRDGATRTTEQVMSLFIRTPFLVIDEFAVENHTTDRLEKAEEIIRERDRLGAPTLYTTNYSLAQVYERWQPRIADIVAKAHWVAVAGAKLRSTAKEAGAW